MIALKKLRQEKGISQKIVAEYLNISQQAYANYERGFRQPDFETLKKIANYFNVTVDYLLDNEIKPTTSKGDELREILQNDPQMQAIYEKLKLLNKDNLEKAIDYLELLKHSQDK